jgi:hypothetical protein
MTTTSSATPILSSYTPTAVAGGMSIELVFNTAMAAGSGTILITDGAVQTVIDRATGQPTMRVVGANDTHTISADSVSIGGAGNTHVTLNVPGLLPGHQYSIVMGNGVLVSSEHVAFGGVRSTSQLPFATPVTPGGDGPALVSHDIDASLLKAGGSLHVTLTFSEVVNGLTADALSAPNATVSGLVAVGDGHSWLATLTPSGVFEQATNVLAIDMSKVKDAAGNAGKGSSNIATYAVDTKGPGASIALDGAELGTGHDIVATISFSEAVRTLDPAALLAGHASISNLTKVGDGSTWQATLSGSANTTAGGNLLSLDLGKVADLAGNPGSGIVKSAGYAVDTQAPAGVSIALGGSLLKTGGSVGVTFTFSEAVKGFTAAAVNAPHAAVGNLVSADDGHTWTATLTALDPNTSSGNLVSVDMSKLQDLHGNAGSGSFVSTASYAIDTVAAAVADIQLNGSLVSHADGAEVVIRFSEKVSLDADAISAPNATLQNLSSSDGGLTWTASLRPGSPAEASGNKIAVDLSKVHDAAGNAGSGSALSSGTYDVDTRGPGASIALDGAELRYGAGIEVTITLSDRASADDLLGALSAQNALVSGLRTTEEAPGLVWKATLVSDGSAVAATNALSLDLSKLRDAHGNAGTGSVTSSPYAVDNTVHSYVDSGIRIVDGTGADGYDNVTNNDYQSIFGTLSGTLDAGQHLALTIKGADGTVNYEVGTDSREWDYGGQEMHLDDGDYTITARVVDAAGHASAAAVQQITIDTVGPAMLSSPDGGSGSAGDALVFSFDEAMYLIETEGASLYFTDTDGKQSAAYIYESNFSADRKTLTIPASQHHLESGKDYTITLSSYLTDLAGNSIRNLDPMHFRTSGVDTLAPTATEAYSLSPAGMYGIGDRIEIAVGFSEAVRQAGSGTPVLHLNNGGLATWDHVSADGRTVVFEYIVGANGENDTYGSESIRLVDNTDLAGHVSDLAGNLLDQAHIRYSALDIYVEDGYGHHSGGIIQVDAHASPAPGTPVLANDSGASSTDGLTNAPVFTGSGTASFATIQLFDSATLVGTTSSNADGNWTIGSFTLPDGTHTLLDGTHSLMAKQVDGFGNVSTASGALTITVDATIAPATVALDTGSDSGSSHGDLLTNVTMPKFTGTGEVGAELKVFDGSTKIGELRIDSGGTYELTLSSPLAEGEHTITVEQTDLAGNTSPRSASTPLTFRIDATATAAPGTPVLDAASDTGVSHSDGITSDKTPTISGVALEGGGTIKVYEGGSLLGTTTAGTDGKWSFTIGSPESSLTQFADGVHTLTARQTDAAGNLSAMSTGLAITIDTAGPTLNTTELEWNSDKHRYELEFSEQIVFAADKAVDVFDAFNFLHSHYAGNTSTNWSIGTNDLGVASVLELNLGTLIGLFGHFYLKADTSAILDVAGNAAVVGTPDFDLPH